MRRLMRFIRFIGVSYSVNYIYINNENYFSFFVNSRRYWKIWRADFGGLFFFFFFFALRIRVRSCWRSVSGYRFNILAMALLFWSIRRSRRFFSLWNSIICWLWRFFSLFSVWRIGFTSRWRSILSMSCNWRRRFFILIRWASLIVARRFVFNGILFSAFFFRLIIFALRRFSFSVLRLILFLLI